MDARAHCELLLDTLRLGAASEDHDRAGLADRWAAANQDVLVAHAIREGADLWLRGRLRAESIVLRDAPQQALDAAARNARARTMRADAAFGRVAAIFAAEGIQMVPLKSTALRRLTERLAFAGARATSDVDLLVREDDAERAMDALRASRFTPAEKTGPWPKNHPHLEAVVDEMGVGIEVHKTTDRAIPPAEAWRRATRDAQSAEIDNLRLQLPNDTELLWHALAHAHYDACNKVARSTFFVRLRNWLDGAVLLAGGAIEWPTVLSRLDAGELQPTDLARAWLRWAAILGGRAAPSVIVRGASTGVLDLRRLLAWRLNVYANYPTHTRWREKLLDESTRAEVGLPRLRKIPGDSLGAATRRSVATLAARGAYAAWRVRLAASDRFSGGYPKPSSPLD